MQAQSKKIITVTALFLFFLSNVFSQERIVTGTVKTKEGIGISGATVRSSSTNRATVTDTLGIFKIGLAEADKTLNVSSLGFFSNPFLLVTVPASILFCRMILSL
ncbi:MAG: carboxypeptidase-like regulatory domain-containing protein [Ferruginibacter sp.]